jgi:hypothetical protein
VLACVHGQQPEGLPALLRRKGTQLCMPAQLTCSWAMYTPSGGASSTIPATSHHSLSHTFWYRSHSPILSLNHSLNCPQGNLRRSLEALGVDILMGAAKFVGPNKVGV